MKSVKVHRSARRRLRRRLASAALALTGALVIVIVAVAASLVAESARWSGTSAGVWFAALVVVWLVGSVQLPRARRRQ